MDMTVPLTPADRILVEGYFSLDMTAPESVRNTIVTTIDGVHLTERAMRRLNVGQPMELDLFEPMLQMLRKRDRRICEAHAEVNHERANYSYYMPSLYCSPSFWQALLADPERAATSEPFASEATCTTHRVYCTVKDFSSGQDDWKIVIIDLAAKTLYYLDPATRDHPDEILRGYEEKINRFLLVRLGDRRGDPWKFTSLPILSVYALKEDDFNGGMYVATILQYLSFNCPLAFTATDVNNARKKWAFWLLLKDLPS